MLKILKILFFLVSFPALGIMLEFQTYGWVVVALTRAVTT